MFLFHSPHQRKCFSKNISAVTVLLASIFKSPPAPSIYLNPVLIGSLFNKTVKKNNGETEMVSKEIWDLPRDK